MRLLGRCVGFGWIVCAAFAQGQASGAGAKAAKTADAAGDKALAFDVVSIRQNLSRGVHDDFGPTADGYRMINRPLFLLVMTAYVPQSDGAALFTPDTLVGLPEWAMGDNYDVEAKVPEADLADWQKPALQPAMLRAMLQAMLADRFKLAVHREMKDVSVYTLVVGKNGPKFKETPPDEAHPGAMAIPGGGGYMSPGDGGQSVHFYDATIATFASLLSGLAGRPIEDKTGLTGRYDLTFPKPVPASADVADPGPTLSSVLDGLGLKLEAAKGQEETLVVDHVERPSGN
jgi:bla regulator protein BlaR1